MNITSAANPVSGVRPLTVTVETARKVSGLGNTTVWKLIRERKLETVHVGRRTLVTVRSLEQLLSPDATLGPLARRRGRPRKTAHAAGHTHHES